MFGQEGRTFLRVLGVVSIAVPFAIMVWNIEFGAIALLFGMLLLYRTLRLVRLMEVKGADAHEAALYRKANSGQTIYVQLIDDAGKPLPSDIAQAKIAEAQRRAGPRDTVLGVHRKL